MHLSMLDTFSAHGGLLGCTAPFPGVLGAVIADRMEVVGVELSVGDIVIFGEVLGMIAACCQEGDDLYVVVRVLTKIRDRTSTAGEYTVSDALTVWLALSCMPATAWRDRPDGSKLVLRR